MLLTTLLRELLASAPFDRIPEPDLVMESDAAVSAFVRAGQPAGTLSGVYAFHAEQACRMIRPGDRVLDLGCGPSQLLASVAALKPDATFVGIDRSAPMVAIGAAVLRRAAARNVDLRVDDMTELSSVDSGSIDVVLSSMALHHLPDTDHLHRCFDAIARVAAPGARVFISDFGRLRRLQSVDYFVRRSIPPDEPVLARDYRASLRAAFSPEELSGALTHLETAFPQGRSAVSLYSTIVSPMVVVVMTPFPEPSSNHGRIADDARGALPRKRRVDYRQLRLFLRLGGMPLS